MTVDQYLLAALTTGYVQADEDTPTPFYGECGKCNAHTMVTTRVEGDGSSVRSSLRTINECAECKSA
jgi:hypothetical protein